MKATGIVRKVDELGRIVIPKETRKIFEIEEKDSLEIYTDANSIILKKYLPCCIFCGQAKNTENFRGKLVCNECKKELSNM